VIEQVFASEQDADDDAATASAAAAEAGPA
jgi:hypothetical protein